MSIRIDVTAIIKVPKVPNFLVMDNGERIPISAIKEEFLREIGEAWTEELIRSACKMKEPTQ